MTPQEFTRLLRERIHTDLSRLVTPLRGDLTRGRDIDPDGLERFMSNPGTELARRMLIPNEAANRANSVLFAIYRSPAFYEYMQRATAALEHDTALQASIKKMTLGADPVNQDEALAALRQIVENDALITGPLQVMHEDPAIRAALGVPNDETFDTYIQRVRRTIRDANSLDEILSVAKCGAEVAPAFCTATICVAIVSVVSLAAVVHTAMGAVNYAFVYVVAANTFLATWVHAVTAHGLPDAPDRLSLVQAGPMRSFVANELPFPVWVVVNQAALYKRVPLASGMSSFDLGLTEVRAVLVGGRGNQLTELATERDGARYSGAYVLTPWRAGCEAAGVTLRVADGRAAARPNDVQVDAECGGRGGFADAAGNGSGGALWDRRFEMQTVAAAFPPTFDLLRTLEETCDTAHFYQALRFSRVTEFVKGRSRHAR